MYKGSNLYHINSCEVVEVFYKIRTDIDKLKFSSYATKIISDVTTENQDSYKILQLFLNTLYVIAETEKDLELVISIFRLRLISIIGFKPEVDKCKGCKTGENLTHFSFKDSGFKCEACSKQDSAAIEISETTIDAVRYIILSDPKKLYSFNVSEKAKNELKILSKIYLEEKLEKEYKI